MRTSTTVRAALVILAGAAFPIACGDASQSGTGGYAAGVGSSGGTESGATSGGTTGGTGSGSTGGSTTGGSTTGGVDDPATCVHEGPPVLDPATLPACDTCGGGHCVPSAIVPADQAGSLASCDADNLCVPDEFIVTGGDFLLDTCESVNGAEGRCASLCLPQVAEQADKLPQDSCADTHRCAPCFDPLTAESTGLCDLACDSGPVEPAPAPLPRCCGDIGQCVPSNLVPPEQADQLGPDECPQDGGALSCVPDVFLNGIQPAACETGFISFLFGDEYKPGVCLAECIPQVDSTPFLGQDDCAEGEKCAPCLDPTTGESSGACDPI
jgi:hypothetical protein